MEISSGIFNIIETGTVITVNNEPIDFLIQGLRFRFKFITDTSVTGNRVLAEELTDGIKGIQLVFTNYNNSLGIGNKQLLRVGWIGDRILYLNYRIYSLQPEMDKTIHYTWYLGEKKDG